MLVEALGRASGRETAPRWPAWGQALLAALLAAFFYTALHSELPIDDTDRFTPHIAAGVFEWDPSHLLMQPAVVLWHRYLGFGETARASQERFNAFCAALSLGIFYFLLLRLGVGPAWRVLLTALAACSYNLLNLATSGHIKLAVLPFLTLSLAHAMLWERDETAGGSGRGGLLAASAVELGIACVFLISSALIAPFLALAVLGVSLRAGRGLWRSLGRAAAVGALSGGTALAVLAGSGQFLGLLASKSVQRPPSAGAIETLARGVFGTVQSFVYVGNFGAMLRTWMAGDGSFLAAHRRTFLAEGAVFLAAAALLAWIYGEALLRLVRGRGAVAVPWAFVLGALAFTIPWNLNESDFYFQIVLPTAALIAVLTVAFPTRSRWITALLLLALVAGTVLPGWALPKRRYPLSRYNAELRARLTPRDLALYWFDYTGGPSLIFMKLPGVTHLYPDRMYERDPDPARFFPRLAHAVDSRLAAGGRVYLFGILDGRTWHAPWPILRREGLTEPRLETFFRERYRVVDRGEIAEIPCWELLTLENIPKGDGDHGVLAASEPAPPPVRLPALPVPHGQRGQDPYGPDPARDEGRSLGDHAGLARAAGRADAVRRRDQRRL